MQRHTLLTGPLSSSLRVGKKMSRHALLSGWTLVLALALAVQPSVNVEALSPRVNPKPLYIALGDSYSSGDGLAPYVAGSGSCDRSPEAYPNLAAKRLRIDSLLFLACSGATIDQIKGQLASTPPSELRRATLTTVTAGGNDLPLSGLIKSCIGEVTSITSSTFTYVSGVSSATLCASSIDGAANLLGAGINPTTGALSRPVAALTFPLSQPSTFQTRLIALYLQILHAEGAIRYRVTGPRLIVVPYPTLLGPEGLDACLLSPSPLPNEGSATTTTPTAPLYPAFANADGVTLGELNTYLQSETSVVVKSLRGEGYLEISLALIASNFVPLNCSTGTSPSINGLLLNGAGASALSGSLHPTAEGQALLATSVVAAWRSAMH
jgi:lysophospholipase L1-like esterase